MTETFAIPAVGAIIVKRVEDEEFILVQTRKKNNGDGLDGLLEIPAGKIREYENIRWVRRDALKEVVDNSPESIFLMHVHALRKYLGWQD